MLNEFTKKIESSSKSGAYLLALLGALSLIDICGALASSNGEASKAEFCKWFDEYVAPAYRGNLDGETCYYFRCSFLHQGRTTHTKSQYKRIVFCEPTDKFLLHNNLINDVLNIDVPTFCDDVCSGVEKYYKDRNGDKIGRAHV